MSLPESSQIDLCLGNIVATLSGGVPTFTPLLRFILKFSDVRHLMA
jgi:hypothetical protein